MDQDFHLSRPILNRFLCFIIPVTKSFLTHEMKPQQMSTDKTNAVIICMNFERKNSYAIDTPQVQVKNKINSRN